MLARFIAFSLLASLMLVAPNTVEAGPPCVCWEVEVGDAPVIDVERRGSDPHDVASKLLASLNERLPVLARMENLRRSALALQGKPAVAEHVLSRLLARVLDAQVGEPKNATQVLALRWFDAGYAVSCFREAGQVSDLDGYAWIGRALTLSGAEKMVGGNGAMHFAAALSVLMPKRRGHGMFAHHLQQMKVAVESDPLLGKNWKILTQRYPAILKHFADKK